MTIVQFTKGQTPIIVTDHSYSITVLTPRDPVIKEKSVKIPELERLTFDSINGKLPTMVKLITKEKVKNLSGELKDQIYLHFKNPGSERGYEFYITKGSRVEMNNYSITFYPPNYDCYILYRDHETIKKDREKKKQDKINKKASQS